MLLKIELIEDNINSGGTKSVAELTHSCGVLLIISSIT